MGELVGNPKAFEEKIDALNSNIVNVTEGTITTSHSIYSNDTWLRKKTGVVNGSISMSLTSNVSRGTSIASLPNGFKPHGTFYIGDVAGIFTNGSIVALKAMSSGEDVSFSFCFVTE